MNVILANGTTLTPLAVTSAQRIVQGEPRNVIIFTFNGDVSLDELDALFAAENCETIKIIETMINEMDQEVTNEFIYHNYTLREQLKSEMVQTAFAEDRNTAIYEKRITVSMAQRTQMEIQLASLVETVDILVMENLFSGEEEEEDV